MADRLTSADIIAVNTSEEIVGIIYEISKQIPELDFFAASPVAKTSYSTVVRTELPTAGFREINQGRKRNIGKVVKRTVDCKILDASWSNDTAAMDGIDWGDPFEEMQTAHLLAAMKSLQMQIWNGGTGGFPGLNSVYDKLGKDGVVGAGGTTANTGSSIYFVKTGKQDACLAWGNEGEIKAGEIREQELYDSEGDPYTGYVQKIQGWAGLQLTNHNAVLRIANVTAQSGKGATDDLIYQGIEKFAERYGVQPDGIWMGHRSRGQLRASRTATNVSGTPAPIPTDVEGIPVFATNGITAAEAIITSS